MDTGLVSILKTCIPVFNNLLYQEIVIVFVSAFHFLCVSLTGNSVSPTSISKLTIFLFPAASPQIVATIMKSSSIKFFNVLFWICQGQEDNMNSREIHFNFENIASSFRRISRDGGGNNWPGDLAISGEQRTHTFSRVPRYLSLSYCSICPGFRNCPYQIFLLEIIPWQFPGEASGENAIAPCQRNRFGNFLLTLYVGKQQK